MTEIASFTFNPFQENTYIIYEAGGECIIIDPGCYQPEEKATLIDFIQKKELTPVRLLNTHCHIDHVFGNRFVADTYGLGLEIPAGELMVLNAVPQIAQMYGLSYPEPSPVPTRFIAEGEIIEFGSTELKTLLTPGHSPASMSFYCEAAQFLIAGDVLFDGSIGRTDLPGGDMDTLLESIRTQFLVLPDEVVVYPGHMSSTTIGKERRTNPFLQ
ncbi:MAG: MBL fold metallo-hydrolase [Bacteroidota bacterium]